MTAQARSDDNSVSLIDVSTYLPGEPIGADYYAQFADSDDLRDNFDIGWSAGAGYTTRIGLGIGGRYNYGFRNIVKENSAGVSRGDIENRVISFGLTYMFGAYK